jgi:kinesin family member 5
MEGSDIRDVNTRGIVPRALESLFSGVAEADESTEFVFKVSYIEIYMEKIRDLLDDNRVKVNLTIREDKIKGVYIVDVTEVYVTSNEEVSPC